MLITRLTNITLILTALLSTASTAGAVDPPQTAAYQYFVDLTKVENDGLTVELIAPRIEENDIRFYLPKVVPGTYEVSDFGRFVSAVQAFDQQGQSLPVQQLDVNTWKIEEAKRLYKVRYRVDDTYDAGGDHPVMGMAGTNIEESNFLVNGHGVFGYFEDRTEQPFEVTFTKPDGFFGATALRPAQSTKQSETYHTPNYFQLVDNPMLFTRPDTALLQVGNAEVLVSIYSPSGNIKADYVGEHYRKLLAAQQAYLGGTLPVDRYAFLMYFYDPQTFSINGGALEHHRSSVYCLPDIPQEQIISFLIDIAAHEFFHIVTPLNVHSHEIHYFDFNDPDMSRHLWMYEGVTEYFSHHAQVSEALITPEEFLTRMGEKIKNSKTLYNDELAFTEMSRNVLYKYNEQFGNVYEKGALIAMCLDIELRRLSNGDYGVVDLMHELTRTYGNNQPFKDKKLFSVIGKMTYPEAKSFLKRYVDSDTPIPYGEFLAKVGVEYVPPKDTLVYSLGGMALKLNQETGRLEVDNVYSMDAFGRSLGYQVGDQFAGINGKAMPKEKIGAFLQQVLAEMKEGQPFSVEVYRKSEGKESLVTLSAPVSRIRVFNDPSLRLNENVDEQTRQLREKWLQP